MQELIKKFKLLLGNEKNVKIIVFIGIAGMALILISSFFTGNKEPSGEVGNDIIPSFDEETKAYEETVKKQLKAILDSIEGVGESEVLVSISGSYEYVYAQEEKKNKSGSDGNANLQEENKYIIIDKKGEKEALVKRINAPMISGVVIVCEGGDEPVVNEMIYRAVSAAVDLPLNRIYVAKKKNIDLEE
jgi:stage III sporulation protein AG